MKPIFIVLIVVLACISAPIIYVVASLFGAVGEVMVSDLGKITPNPPTSVPVLVPTTSPLESAIRAVCRDGLIAVTGDAQLLTVDCKLKSGLTDEGVVSIACADMFNLTKGVFAVADVQVLQFRLTGDFKDKFGNVAQEQAIAFRVPKSLHTKINWANLHYVDFGKLLQSGESGAAAVVHPYYRAAWAGWLGQ